MEDNDWIFKKLPNWLRWILFLPVAALGSMLVPFITRFTSNWAYGNTQGVLVFDILQMIVSALGLLAGIYFCVPKHKNAITGFFSIILAIYFSVMTTLFLTRGYPITDSNTIINILSTIASIVMAYMLLTHKEEQIKSIESDIED